MKRKVYVHIHCDDPYHTGYLVSKDSVWTISEDPHLARLFTYEEYRHEIRLKRFPTYTFRAINEDEMEIIRVMYE